MNNSELIARNINTILANYNNVEFVQIFPEAIQFIGDSNFLWFQKDYNDSQKNKCDSWVFCTSDKEMEHDIYLKHVTF